MIYLILPGGLLGFALGRPTITSKGKEKEWKYKKNKTKQRSRFYLIKNSDMGSIFQRPKRSMRDANPGNLQTSLRLGLISGSEKKVNLLNKNNNYTIQ